MTVKEVLNNTHKYGLRYMGVLILYKFGIVKENAITRCVEPYYLNLTPEEREKELKEWFFNCMGYKLNLDNPNTFNEKIQWLKLYDSTPQKTYLADKYQVREWVSEKIGKQYLVPLLGVWDSFNAIDFSTLPTCFVLKATHGSHMDIIVRDNKTINKRVMKREINGWLRTDYGINQTQQWHYMRIPHRVIAEQYLETKNGDLPDYKVYCFNGIPTYIQVINGRFNKEYQIFMDTEWKVMPFGHTDIEMMESAPERPRQLDNMLQLSKILSEDFSFVRVDWYIVDKKLYFGEMTFTPASGVRHWIPEGTDKMLGQHIELPKEKFIINSK